MRPLVRSGVPVAGAAAAVAAGAAGTGAAIAACAGTGGMVAVAVVVGDTVSGAAVAVGTGVFAGVGRAVVDSAFGSVPGAGLEPSSGRDAGEVGFASPVDSGRLLESLLDSLLDSLLESVLESLPESLVDSGSAGAIAAGASSRTITLSREIGPSTGRPTEAFDDAPIPGVSGRSGVAAAGAAIPIADMPATSATGTTRMPRMPRTLRPLRLAVRRIPEVVRMVPPTTSASSQSVRSPPPGIARCHGASRPSASLHLSKTGTPHAHCQRLSALTGADPWARPGDAASVPGGLAALCLKASASVPMRVPIPTSVAPYGAISTGPPAAGPAHPSPGCSSPARPLGP